MRSVLHEPITALTHNQIDNTKCPIEDRRLGLFEQFFCINDVYSTSKQIFDCPLETAQLIKVYEPMTHAMSVWLPTVQCTQLVFPSSFPFYLPKRPPVGFPKFNISGKLTLLHNYFLEKRKKVFYDDQWPYEITVSKRWQTMSRIQVQPFKYCIRYVHQHSNFLKN